MRTFTAALVVALGCTTIGIACRTATGTGLTAELIDGEGQVDLARTMRKQAP